MLVCVVPPLRGKRHRRTVRSMHELTSPKDGPRAFARVTEPDAPMVTATSIRIRGA